MTHARFLKQFALAGVTAAALFIAAPSYAEVTDQDLVEKVAAAQTSADHLEIATYYRGLADASAAKVKLHQRMRTTMSTGKGGATWHGHCASLIQAYKNAEKEAQAMAQEHEALAKSAK